MEYGYLGKSNVTVSKICLGTMHFGSKTEEKESFAIMDKALELGINFFDTANVYGDVTGRTEEIIGRWFKQGGGRRDSVVLATKVYNNMMQGTYVPNDEKGISAYKVKKQLADSLRRLQTDHIDLYQVHHIDRRVTGEEFWGSFEYAMSSGDITYVGTSNFPGWGIAKFQMIAEQRGLLGFVSEQTQYNLLNRMPELEVIPSCREFGLGLLAYMPVGGGLLTGKKPPVAGSRTEFVEKEYGIGSRLNDQLIEFGKICKYLGEQEHIVAIAWTLANPVVSSAILGVRTLEHLNQIEKAAELKLGEEVMKKLDQIFNINHGRPLLSNEAPEAYSW